MIHDGLLVDRLHEQSLLSGQDACMHLAYTECECVVCGGVLLLQHLVIFFYTHMFSLLVSLCSYTCVLGICSCAVYSAWTNTSFKAPLLACTVLLIAGNVLYGLALSYNAFW